MLEFIPWGSNLQAILCTKYPKSIFEEFGGTSGTFSYRLSSHREENLAQEELYSNYHHPGILQTIHMIVKNVFKHCPKH